MRTMAPKLRAQGTQPPTRAATPDGSEAALLRSIRTTLENHLKGRRLVSLKVRQIEGKKVDGILKIEGLKGELQMVDFKATTGPKGTLTFLEVGGRRISSAVSGS
jgi:hypothetical protein